METVWIWSDNQLPAIGSGIRRVRWKDHPRRKGYVKVYPMHEGNPVVLGKDEFLPLILEGKEA